MSSDVMLKVNNVSKIYKLYKRPADRLLQFFPFFSATHCQQHKALDSVSFELIKGETLAIVGCNGSGKSTLLQIICGTLTPTSGKIEVNGRIVALLELGAGFNPEFTGEENVYLCGQLYGLDKTEVAQKFSSILDFSGIGEKIYQPVKNYSSGMFVRLAFSVIAHLDPQVLIVDEALAVGDFIFQQKCARFMKDTLSGVTKILVSHDLAAVAALADRVMVLHDGEQIFLGDPQTALAIYQKVARDADSIKLGIAEQNSGTKELKATERWSHVQDEKISGAGRARIEKYTWRVSGRECVTVIQKGDLLTVEFLLEVKQQLDQPMIGYQVQNRLGMVIFGDNTHSSDLKMKPLVEGLYRATLEVIWPQVEPGEYGITIGIGDGLESASHIVECWAHNVIILGSIQTDPIHGIFNNKLENFEIGLVM